VMPDLEKEREEERGGWEGGREGFSVLVPALNFEKLAEQTLSQRHAHTRVASYTIRSIRHTPYAIRHTINSAGFPHRMGPV
jgi:hypothetical protein